MTTTLRGVVLAMAVVGATSAAVFAQPGPGAGKRQAPRALEDPAEVPLATPNEVGRLFDAYTIVQAQEQMGLSEEQFGRFLPRFKALVEARRREMQGRMRLLNQLNRLSRATPPDENALRDQLKALIDHETASAAEVRSAREALIALLTPLQHARFRLFEEQVELRKLDLMTRARQGMRRNQRVP